MYTLVKLLVVVCNCMQEDATDMWPICTKGKAAVTGFANTPAESAIASGTMAVACIHCVRTKK